MVRPAGPDNICRCHFTLDGSMVSYIETPEYNRHMFSFEGVWGFHLADFLGPWYQVHLRGRPTGFPGGPDGKQSACSSADRGLISGLGRSPGEGKGSPLQHSCLENLHGQRLHSLWGKKDIAPGRRAGAPPVWNSLCPSQYRLASTRRQPASSLPRSGHWAPNLGPK